MYAGIRKACLTYQEQALGESDCSQQGMGGTLGVEGLLVCLVLLLHSLLLPVLQLRRPVALLALVTSQIGSMVALAAHVNLVLCVLESSTRLLHI